ncbi:MAG: hypothetical protein WD425_08135 [Nitrospirales bacterium]
MDKKYGDQNEGVHLSRKEVCWIGVLSVTSLWLWWAILALALSWVWK